jgi:hypothetical protein
MSDEVSPGCYTEVGIFQTLSPNHHVVFKDATTAIIVLRLLHVIFSFGVLRKEWRRTK